MAAVPASPLAWRLEFPAGTGRHRLKLPHSQPSCDSKAGTVEAVIQGAILARAFGRVFSAAFYPWLFGPLQLVLVIILAPLWPRWLPILGALALAGLLAALALLRDRWRLKTVLLLLAIGLLTVVPTISAMVRRAHEGIGSLEQDSAIQTELAVDRFLHGAPIYGADWSNTPLAKMAWASDLAPTNPALHHYVYFPLTFLSAVPVRLLAGALGLAFDYRMVILLFVAIGLVAAWLLPIPAADRFAIAIALFLNPLITLYLWSGRNDVCFASLILLGLALLARGRVVASSLAIGFASAFKLFAAPAIPFLLVILWLRFRRRRDGRELLVSVVALVAFPIATILPFVLQAPHPFIQDVVLYPGGGLPDSYPIAGFGFGMALVLLGVVHRHDYFPFGVLQAAAMAAAGWLGVRAVLGRPTLRRWMLAYVGLFFALSFFARYFNDSHVGVLATMALCCRPLGNGLLVRQPAEPALVEAA